MRLYYYMIICGDLVFKADLYAKINEDRFFLHNALEI
jgi:hypothetical protein